MENILRELEELRIKYHQSEESRHTLEDKNTNLKAERLKLTEQNAVLQKLVAHYEELYRLNKHRKFGQSSEKSFYDEHQTLLVFDEAENEADAKKPEPTTEEISAYVRHKRSGTGSKEDDYSSLPVETVVHSMPEAERICPECGGPMHVMSVETRRELVIVPAKVKIVEHQREIYSCRRCEHENTTVPVVRAPMPEPVIKGSAASPSFVAHIMTQKYVNALPLYRQEISFLNEGFLLSRQTMANWLIKAANEWLAPLYEQLRNTLLAEDILHADETVLQVLKEPGRKARQESFMWLYRTGQYTANPIVLYDYQTTRSSANPIKFLTGFKGHLHADGYSGYKTLAQNSGGNIKLCGCWAHARRKFNEAIQSAPPEVQENCISRKGLEYCDKLFALERRYEQLQLPPEARRAKRLEQSKQVTDEFFSWAEETYALPKSALGKAINYALEQRPYLEAFYTNGRLEISNNRAERSIKPFVIGRKNWLFCNTAKGARASAVIYSVIETAKENGLNPYEYLKHLFTVMPNMPKERYKELLPWSKSLPDNCRRKAAAGGGVCELQAPEQPQG